MIQNLKTLFNLLNEYYKFANSMLFKTGKISIETEEIILRFDFSDGNSFFTKRITGKFDHSKFHSEFISANDICQKYKTIETLIRIDDVIYPGSSVVKVSLIRIPATLQYQCFENDTVIIEGKKVKAKNHPSWTQSPSYESVLLDNLFYNL